MDYRVKDSSLLRDIRSMAAVSNYDCSIKVGIVREQHFNEKSGITYIVEVLSEGKQVPTHCVPMSRFGGAHNFEETTLRPWLNGFPSGTLLPASVDEYKGRSGDVVLVAYLNGKSKEGVILGGLSHPARKPKLKKGKIAYLSEFNGIETSITDDGSYKVSFKGYLPTNDAALKIPPLGQDVPAPLYNPLTGGSYYGFSNSGSFVASDGSQFIKIHKNIVSGSVIIKSGTTQVEIGGNPALGAFGVKTGKVVVDATTNVSVKSTIGMSFETLQLSLKGMQIAIGNDQFELFDGLIQLIDALGTLVVTSPVGTCTPLMSAPTWAAQVLPLKIKLSLVKGSLKSADSFSLAGDDDPKITSNE